MKLGLVEVVEAATCIENTLFEHIADFRVLLEAFKVVQNFFVDVFSDCFVVALGEKRLVGVENVHDCEEPCEVKRNNENLSLVLIERYDCSAVSL